jgi:hypothetical protein
MVVRMLALVHCHKHTDTKYSGLQEYFKVSRDVQYKYSKKAEEAFFNDPFYCFLYHRFYCDNSFSKKVFFKDEALDLNGKALKCIQCVAFVHKFD